MLFVCLFVVNSFLMFNNLLPLTILIIIIIILLYLKVSKAIFYIDVIFCLLF